MDNVAAGFNLSISCQGDNSDIATADLGTAKDEVAITRGESYADGTGSGQVNVVYHDILPVTTLDEIDLNGTVLKDAFGVGLEITKLKALFIKNLTGGLLTIGAATNPIDMFGTPATHTLELVDDGQWLMTWPGDGLDIDGGGKGELEFVHAVGGAQNIEIIAVGVR